MHEGAPELTDLVDRAVAASIGVLDESDLEEVARMSLRTRARLAYPSDLAVAALVGGTGSGKSSLLNALAGEPVAETGGIRPTTQAPLALVPQSRSSALATYLDLLDVDQRCEWEGSANLCLLDLPDTDSIAFDHRHAVQGILPWVDLVVWVLDPEKYRDDSIHRGFIAELAGYSSQFLFVLNQMDRIDHSQWALLADDLGAALRDDGIDDPRIYLTAANPPAGPPIGVDELRQTLDDVVLARPSLAKLELDLRSAARRLVAATGGGSSLRFESRWARALDEAVILVAAGDAGAAGHRLAAFVEELARDAGGPIESRLRSHAADVPRTVTTVVADLASPPEVAPGRRRRRKEDGATGRAPADDLKSLIDDVVGGPLRLMLRPRAEAAAAIDDLSLHLATLAQSAG